MKKLIDLNEDVLKTIAKHGSENLYSVKKTIEEIINQEAYSINLKDDFYNLNSDGILNLGLIFNGMIDEILRLKKLDKEDSYNRIEAINYIRLMCIRFTLQEKTYISNQEWMGDIQEELDKMPKKKKNKLFK